MAHLKLFFPGLSTSNGLCHLLYGHSALSSIVLNSQEQSCELPQESSTKTFTASRRIPVQWRRFGLSSASTVRLFREKVENLTYIQDTDSNDYWTSADEEGFVHALQLEEDCRLDDVETVRSERWSNLSRKMSFSSDTESIDCS
jgi:hypothetical protein